MTSVVTRPVQEQAWSRSDRPLRHNFEAGWVSPPQTLCSRRDRLTRCQERARHTGLGQTSPPARTMGLRADVTGRRTAIYEKVACNHGVRAASLPARVAIIRPNSPTCGNDLSSIFNGVASMSVLMNVNPDTGQCGRPTNSPFGRRRTLPKRNRRHA